MLLTIVNGTEDDVRTRRKREDRPFGTGKMEETSKHASGVYFLCIRYTSGHKQTGYRKQVPGYRPTLKNKSEEGNESGKQETLSEPNLEVDFKEPG